MTRKPDPLPDQRAVFMLPDGTPAPDFYRWLMAADRAVRAIIDIIDIPAPEPPDHEFTLVEEWPVVIAFPSDGVQELSLKGLTNRTVTEVVTKCSSGSCTVQVKIDGTALGGTANSVTTAEQSRTHTTSNTWGTGQDLNIEVSSNSDCENLKVTIKTTRTITTTPVS